MADHPTVVLFNGPTRLNTLEIAAPTTVGHILKVAGTSPLSIEWGAAPGGSSDHATLSHLSWTASGHTGTASRIAAFDGGGAAAYLAVGTDVQAWSARLDGLAGTAYSSADLVPYTTGSNTFSTMTVTSTARTLLDDTTTSAMRSTLGVAIGSNVQAWSARLDTIAGLTRNRGDLIVGGSSDWTDLALGASGYYLKSDGTDAVWAALPTGSSSTAGLVELAAYGEGQTDTATARVPDVRSDWEIYRPGLPYFGSHWAGPNNTVAIGDYGTCDGAAVSGTWNSGRDSNSGLHYAEVATSTGTQRNILWATNGASMSSWSYGDMRFSFLMRVPGGTANVRYFCGLTLFGGSSVMTSVESTVTAHIRFGWDTTSILAICADGTARTKTTFSTSTTGSTSVYEFEIVPNRGMTSVVFNLYTWTATGGRGALVESQTISTNIPSGGSTTIYPGVWALATSGTPNVQWYGTRFMINLT